MISKMKCLGISFVCFAFGLVLSAQQSKYSETYFNLQKELAKGWNTWNTESMLSHVLLPEAIAVNICLNPTSNGASYLKEVLPTVNSSSPVKVTPGWHTSDGSYTEISVEWKDVIFKVQTAAEGDQWVALITTIKTGMFPPNVIIESGILWNKPGELRLNGTNIHAKAGNKDILIGTTNIPVTDYIPSNSPYLAIPMDGEIGIYAGKPMALNEIKELIEKNRTASEKLALQYQGLSEVYRAMSSILGWNTIYDPENKRVITPVSRNWNVTWGGWVLFDWDTYFASYMFSLYNKDLAYANAVEMTKSITPGGFVPNFACAYKKASVDRSQPPVGSFVIKELYRHYGDKWLLEETYNELLTWNRWWPRHRNIGGYLSWGSDPVNGTPHPWNSNDWQAAAFESGLDNSPMYDRVPFNKSTHTLELADVGLMAFYSWDCANLAEIADILGKKEDVKELKAREEEYNKKLQTLWSEGKGIYLNKRTDTEEFSERLSPTNFYPLLAKAPAQLQAERMMKDHYFNPREFQAEWVIPSIARNDPAFTDQNYWRGRIWAPMNFLVYLGMLNYNLPDARKDLVKRSYDLFMHNWIEKGSVPENCNAITGYADDVSNSDPFYHWGALNGFMSFIEQGYLPSPVAKNNNSKK